MKIAVLLSGGVDSSVALRLLKDERNDVTAFYLKIWLQDEYSFLGECPWEEDLKYARSVCEEAKVPLEVISLQTEYWDSVVSYTIKFGQFYDKIDNSFEKVASGHYARLEETNGKFNLMRSPDPVKDQTYFLAYLTQKQFSRALFPIGKHKKEEVRALAEKYQLPNKSRKDSQGICFLGQVKFNEFIKHHLGVKSGDIVNADTGKIMGEHNGYYYFTIGQRSGLGLSGGPWYVVKKDIEKNLVFISRENIKWGKGSEFTVGKFNWISGSEPAMNNMQVKIRHGAASYNCKLELNNNKIGHVFLDETDRGIAPGQFAVFYNEQACLGGGVIL
jgi:tRNA (5-methylaminomethyl-2-thiouridylate)-methyltransferase